MKTLIVCFAVILWAIPGWAQYGNGSAEPEDFRCGNLFIEKGVHSFQVLKNCGEPDYMEVYQEADCCDDIYIEKWIYGPDAGYYYILFFRLGVLTRLETARVIW